MAVTVIRDADWIVAWNADTARHCYMRHGDVAFDDTGAILHVGGRYAGAAETEIDGASRLVLPGFIDLHSHPSTEPSYKGIREEHGVPAMYMSGLYERSLAFNLDPEGQQAGATVAFAELLQSGVTSLVDISGAWPGWLDTLAASGLRGWVAPWFGSARWTMTTGHRLEYAWSDDGGRASFDAARRVMDEADRHPCGRLTGLYGPGVIDACTEELLRETVSAAETEGRRLTTHISQSVVEFNEMVQRHGITPVQWAQQIGLLGPRTILGHAIFIDEHSWLHWSTRRDLDLIAQSGAAVAHCPTPFARYGQTLEDFGRYLRAGVTMGIGTDTLPHNFLEEMRWATVLARVAAEDIETLQVSDVFHAATVGGATALGRDDLGRLATGCRADIVLVDTSHPAMRPTRDPLRSLVFSSCERAVAEVFVDGRQVVADGRATGLDVAAALDSLDEAQARMEADVPNHDHAGRRALDIAPLSLDLRA